MANVNINNHTNYQSFYYDKSPIWFSHRENRYNIELKFLKKVVKWTEKSQIWNWDNCYVSAVKRENGKVRVIIRSSKKNYSTYRKKWVKLKYMLGFDIDHISEIGEDEYEEPIVPNNNLRNERGKARSRLFLKLDKDYYIWQWKENESSRDNIELATIQKNLKNVQTQPYDPQMSNIFQANLENNTDDIMPVIYQPAIDSLKNFLREVHCDRSIDNVIKVTLVFNNEHLRKHKYLDMPYRLYRLIRFRRILDIESFIICLEDHNPSKLQFPNIYSGNKNIEYDNVHGDRSLSCPVCQNESPESTRNVKMNMKKILDILFGKLSSHKTKYFFINKKHPVIFINTANHAMSHHDTNHRLWKWEYIPWEEDSPVIIGQKSRSDLEKVFDHT